MSARRDPLGREVRYPRSRLDIDLASRFAHREAEVDVFARGEHLLVEAADAPEDVGAHEHAVEFGAAGRRRRVRNPRLVDSIDQVTAQAALLVGDGDFRVAAGKVQFLTQRPLFEVDGSHDRRTARLRAFDERRQPIGCDDNVVVDEHQVSRLDARRTDVARLIGRQVAVVANQFEALGARALAKIAGDGGRRRPVDVNERADGARKLEDAFEPFARVAEMVAGHDDDRHIIFVHAASGELPDSKDSSAAPLARATADPASETRESAAASRAMTKEQISMALTEFDARPQTNLQLYALLLEAGRDATVLRGVRDAYALATRLFAGLMRPEGRPFVCHIVGVAGILAMLDASLPTVVGGLLHSAYTHGDFGRGCGEVNRAARDRIRAAVGGEIEGIVSAYAALSWDALSVERYAAEVGAIGAETRRILAIRLANELEDALDDGLRLSRKSENPHRAIVVDNLVGLAVAVGQPRLATALQSALGQRRGVIELELLQRSSLGLA